jgi:DivIVA domain-containing protein
LVHYRDEYEPPAARPIRYGRRRPGVIRRPRPGGAGPAHRAPRRGSLRGPHRYEIMAPGERGSNGSRWAGMHLCIASIEGVPMETKSHSPSFTVSLRGYDREEVDHYIDSLAEALEQVDDSSEQNRRLHAHINQLNARIKELEDRIHAEAPRTGALVGERIGILLREAEEAAAETVDRAESKAGAILAAAEAKANEADEIIRAALARGEDQSRRIESAARAEAAEIVAEAEARATARTRQIEQWAEQVISHTRAEEARMLREQQEQRKTAKAELQFLNDQQGDASKVLTDLRESLGQALGLIEPSPSRKPETERPAATEAAATEADAEAADSGLALVDEPDDSDDTPVTGDVPLVADLSDRAAEAAARQVSEPETEKAPEVHVEHARPETRLESWVSSASESQRRW